MKPKISIVIPTFNRAHYLPAAIQSSLSQDYANFEVIVSDNASTDATPSVVANYQDNPKLRYYRNDTNLGAIGNIRKAVYEHAQGDWFIVLSDDDYFVDAQYLSKVAQLLEQQSDLSLVFGEGYVWYETVRVMANFELPFPSITKGAEIFEKCGQLGTYNFLLCNVVFPRENAMQLFDAFNNPLNGAGDSELFYKCCAYGDVGIVKGASVVYRVHSGNFMQQHLSDVDLVLNRLFALTNALEMAQKNTWLSADVLDKWHTTVVIPTLQNNLIKLRLTHAKRWDYICSFVKNYLSHYVDEVFSTAFYKRMRLRRFKHYLLYNPVCKSFGVRLQHNKHIQHIKRHEVSDVLKEQLLSIEAQYYR